MRRRAVTTRLRRTNPFLAVLLPLAATALLAYFGYSAFTGALGIWSMDRIEAQAAQLSAQLADLKGQRVELETKVARMRPESLDADLVDATARGALNVMRPDEVILAPVAAR